MSKLENELFYDDAYTKHWATFAKESREEGILPTTRDFMIWLDENNLIPDPDMVDDDPRVGITKIEVKFE